ncbi:MAG TPA: flagellar FliJ family protein [Nocardioidaceae bacterium]|nr:flagellar FliJ family protein [Nocardioidaceae bacterium]
MSIHKTDRGLAAVRRVRSARESDSRIGLAAALAASRRSDERALRAAQRLDQAPAFDAGDPAVFAHHVRVVQALARAERAADEDARSARAVADEARRRWQQDRTAVRAVELLLERRAAERAAERSRREARDLDELAAQAWTRAAEEVSR